MQKTTSSTPPDEDSKKLNEMAGPGSKMAVGALLNRFFESQRPEGERICYDLRRRLREKVGNAFCYFVGVSSFSIAYDQEKNIWKNAQEIHKIIHKDIDRLNTGGPDFELFDQTLIDACFGFAHLMQFIPEAFERTNTLSDFARDTTNIALMFSGSRKNTAIINTNLGRLDYPETYGGLRLDRMFFVPPAANLVPLILGGIGINGRLAFSLNYIEQMDDRGSSLTSKMIMVRNKALEYLCFPEKANSKAM